MTVSVPGFVPSPRPASPLRRRVPLRHSRRVGSAYGPTTGETQQLQYTLQKRSIRCVQELTVRQAREMLATWAAERSSVADRRDEVVRVAVQAGLSKTEVYRLTGIARTTIDRIIGSVSEAGEGGAR